jgi:hypothetical protein
MSPELATLMPWIVAFLLACIAAWLKSMVA